MSMVLDLFLSDMFQPFNLTHDDRQGPLQLTRGVLGQAACWGINGLDDGKI